MRKLLLTFLLIFSLAGNCFADGNDANTVSLLHMDGTDGATTFTDDAIGGTHTWTAANQAQIDTAQSKFGGASGLFDGTGDYIYTADSNDFHFSNGLFTIDCWVRLNALSNSVFLYVQRVASPLATTWFELYADGGTSDYLHFAHYSGGGYLLDFSVATADLGFVWAVNTWYHIAVVRESTADAASSWGIYVDGVRKTLTLASGNWNATLADVASNVDIGGSSVLSARWLNGWLDEVRVSKGVARWTANFTPPTAAYSEAAAAPLGQVIWID